MSATVTQRSTGQPVELGRYSTPADGERILVGRRINGEVHVFDCPGSRCGRRYFVEAGFGSKAELAVLVADYRRRAKRLGTCPMGADAIDAAFSLAPGER